VPVTVDCRLLTVAYRRQADHRLHNRRDDQKDYLKGKNDPDAPGHFIEWLCRGQNVKTEANQIGANYHLLGRRLEAGLTD